MAGDLQSNTLGTVQLSAVAMLAILTFSIRTVGQGTFVMNSATGSKPRITLKGVNAGPADNLRVEVLVEGATSLSGNPSVPFKLTLPGANSGLFSKGKITVGGKPPGTRVMVTIRAWQPLCGNANYDTSLTKGSQTFSIELGGGTDTHGVERPPASIVPAYTGIEIYSSLLWPGTYSTSTFESFTVLPDADGRYLSRVARATPLDLDQSGDAELMLVRMDYYQPPPGPHPPSAADYLFSRDYLLKSRIGGLETPYGPNLCTFDTTAILVSGTRAIPVTFGEGRSQGPLNGWVIIKNGALVDYGYNPISGEPIRLGEKPAGMFPNPNRRFTYEVADLSSVVSERAVVLIQYESIWENNRLNLFTRIVGNPGQFLMRAMPPDVRLVRLKAGEIIPGSLPNGFAWIPYAPESLDFPFSVELAWVEMDLNGNVLRSRPWSGGFIAFRDQGVTWMELSAGTVPKRLSGGHSPVAGGQSDFSSRGPVGTNSYVWNTTREPLDLNGDGTADFMLARTTYLSRSPIGSPVVEDRELALEKIPPSTESTISLGRQALTPDGLYQSGSFGTGPTNFLVRFNSTAGELAGEILVIDPFAGRISTRYEPVPQRAIEHGRLPSLNLSLWRKPFGGLRLTWPAEYQDPILELYRLGGIAGWELLTVVEPGRFDIPTVELGDSRVFRLRQR